MPGILHPVQTDPRGQQVSVATVTVTGVYRCESGGREGEGEEERERRKERVRIREREGRLRREGRGERRRERRECRGRRD